MNFKHEKCCCQVHGWNCSSGLVYRSNELPSGPHHEALIIIYSGTLTSVDDDTATLKAGH